MASSPIVLAPPCTPHRSSNNLPDEYIPVDIDIPDNYVHHVLSTQKELPPLTWSNFYTEIQLISAIALTFTPVASIYGWFTTPLQLKTALFSIFYYMFSCLGITAGYHRLWAHRSYNASRPLEYFLALAGASAIQGSIKWWSRGHRAHHRYTDTDLDPYSAHRGLLWSHIGWMLFKPRRKPGVADVSDLTRNPVVRWQHNWFVSLILLMGILLPTVIPGYFWGDWRGGYFYGALTRLLFVHHSTFCVNSLAHYLGEAPYDDKHTPRDHLLTAILTFGEGYHNFHHQFPMDYRNAIKWYQYDPTKWLIATMKLFGLASHLKVFPENEIKKGQLTMQLKKLNQKSVDVQWPTSSDHLPVISWECFQEQAKTRSLIVFGGFIHDISPFLDEHPGGRHLLTKNIGKDATTAFFGGVYDHSNAAHNLLAMMRVGVLHGGLELESEKIIPPSQRLQIVRGQALAELKHAALHPEPSISTTSTSPMDTEQLRERKDSVEMLPSPPLSVGALSSEDEGEFEGLTLKQ